MTRRPLGVDLFAGAGGLSLGFEQAGFEIAAAVEIDPIHAATHAFNFPQCTSIVRSVVGLEGTEIRRLAHLQEQQVDVIFGGAPCQGFSLIGQRALDDPRNVLVREFVRIVRELSPRYFMFENVKGLTLGTHRRFLDEVIDAFHDIGYRIRLPWRVLNTADYGVPQLRQRLILIGARADCPIPEYPTPSTTSLEPSSGNGLARTPSCRDALGDVPDAEDFDELLDDDEVATNNWGSPSVYARTLRGLRDEQDLSYERVFDPNRLTSSMRTEHTAISRRRFAATKPGEVEPISRFYRLSPDGLSNTLRAGTDSARGAFTSPRPIHYSKPRCITVREMARLHGFPDWFRLHKTKWHGARQIGNSVPPPLARAIAMEIAKALDAVPIRPKAPIELGDRRLLTLDMKGAAAHWKVPVGIGPRDRKSQFKKRRQEDIEAELQAALV
jgi:DNA (cytosine-5)-methyltransferase 1